MIGLIASEWLKTRSLRSVWWSAALTVTAVLLAAVIDRDGVFPLAGYMVLIVVATSSGAAAMVGEYASGLIRATAVAVPARSDVVLAKAVVQICLWTAVGAVITAGLLIVDGRATTVTSAELLGAILVGPACALVGLGLAVLLRQAGAVYVTGILLLVALPQLLTGDNPVVRALHHAMILPGWQRLTLAYGSPEAVGDLYTSATAAWLSYLLWPAVVLGAALVVHQRRDV
jgi:ABC-2 type transport system permease protein